MPLKGITTRHCVSSVLCTSGLPVVYCEVLPRESVHAIDALVRVVSGSQGHMEFEEERYRWFHAKVWSVLQNHTLLVTDGRSKWWNEEPAISVIMGFN